MATFSALSAAIRDRLLADDAAPLPSFGTLRRVRVPARVQAQSDGSRILQPPSESLRLVLGPEPDAGPMAIALARHMGLPISGGPKALLDHVEQLEAMLAVKGEVELEGVGIIRRSDRGLLFGPEPSLLAAINEAYQGLSNVGSASDDAAQPLAPEEVAPVEAETLEPEVMEVAELTSAEAYPPPPPALASSAETTTNSFASEVNADPEVREALEDSARLEPSGDGLHTASDLDAFVITGSDDSDLSSLSNILKHDVQAAADLLEVDAALHTDDGASEDDAHQQHPTEEKDVSAKWPPSAPGDPLLDESVLNETASLEPEATLPVPAAPVDDPEHDPSAPPADVSEFENGPEIEPPLEEPDTPEAGTLPSPGSVSVPPDGGATIEEIYPPTPLDAPDDPVDELLADIWTTGAPAASDLGIATVLDPSASTSSEPSATANPSTSIVRSSEPPPRHVSTTNDPDADGILGSSHHPDGLPMMPVGWTPSGDFDDNYEDDAPPRRSVLPWILGLVVIASLIVAAVFAWPRFVASRTTEPAASTPEPPAADASPSDAELGADLARLDAFVDDSLAATEAESFPEVSLLDGADPQTAAVLSQESSRSGTSSRPTTDSSPRSASRATTGNREPTQQRESAGSVTPSPRGGGSATPLAPDVSGLPLNLARGLAGAAPIQLDAVGFTWVVVSITNRTEAEEMVARYRRAGFRSRVIEASVGNLTVYRVAVGQFETRDDALAVRNRLPSDIRDSDDIWTMNLADA